LHQEQQRQQMQQPGSVQQSQLAPGGSAGLSVTNGGGGDATATGGSSTSAAHTGNGLTLSGDVLSEAGATAMPAMSQVELPTAGTGGTENPSLDALQGSVPSPKASGIGVPGSKAAGVSARNANGASSLLQGNFADEPIWRGSLKVSNQRSNMLVPCVAIKYNLNGRTPIQSTDSWPSALFCGQDVVKKQNELQGFLSDPGTQWYVRLVAVGGAGGQSDLMQKLVQVLIAKNIAFEIMCNEGNGQGRGKLYLMGSDVPGMGKCMLGVFRPDAPQRVDEVALMNSLIGS
jgi:hypothetical protein